MTKSTSRPMSRRAVLGVSGAVLATGLGLTTASAADPAHVLTVPEVNLHTVGGTHELEAFEYKWSQSGIKFGTPGEDLPTLSDSESARITVAGIDDARITLHFEALSPDATAPAHRYEMTARGNNTYEWATTSSLLPAHFAGSFRVVAEVKDGTDDAFFAFFWEF